MNVSIPGVCLITSSQGKGKSYLVKYILSNYQDELSYGVVFSQTAFNEGNFDYMPKEYIYSLYNENALKELMDIQSKQAKSVRKKAFVVLDDCVIDDWVTSEYFLRLVTQVRHYNVLVIITTQYVNKIPPIIRENAFQVAIFQADTKRSLDSLYDSYAQQFETFADFKKYLQKNTGDYWFVWIDKYSDKEVTFTVIRAPKVFNEIEFDF